MPPKKRKAAVVVPIGTDPAAAKKVRIGSTSVIDDEHPVDGLSTRSNSMPAGRPKRATANDSPQYNFVKTRDSTGSQSTRSTTIKTPPKPTSTHVKTPKPPNPAANVKRRGRPPKNPLVDESIIEVKATSPPSYTGNKRGRKPEAQVEVEVVGGATANDADEGDGDVDEETQYWLMKAEPQSRIEKGIDVKFSIDDLASRTEPEGWDGVRNPAARNNMRAMRNGDLAFFYHSNCAIPGVAGVMRVVEEHIIDETAFDPNHPYYDPKSIRDKPKWEMVKVEFVKKFDELVTLKELKSFSAPGGTLAAMQMLKQGRLSVSSVQPAEWRFILDLAGEDASIGQPDLVDGYESDTDGEADTSFSSTQATKGESLAGDRAGTAGSTEKSESDTGTQYSTPSPPPPAPPLTIAAMAKLQYLNDHDPDPEHVTLRNHALSKNNPIGLGPMTRTDINDMRREYNEDLDRYGKRLQDQRARRTAKHTSLATNSPATAATTVRSMPSATSPDPILPPMPRRPFQLLPTWH